MTGTAAPSSDCVMCDIAADTDDRKRLILHRGRTVFVVLNLFPYNTAHTLVVPYEHGGNLSRLPQQTSSEMWETALRAVDVISGEYRPEGFNVGMNLGHVAGAGVPDHLHIHVVPRWGGDTNFMPVTADTKVLPESLEQTWERLRQAFE